MSRPLPEKIVEDFNIIFENIEEEVAFYGRKRIEAVLRATPAKVLKEYYKWCKENGIEKGSVKRFAKEYGILME